MSDTSGAWIGRTAIEMAAAVRAGEVSAREVVGQHLDRIAALDGRVGAFVRVRADDALVEADSVDARPDRSELPLAGVPIAIKDNIAVAGEPMRSGSAATPATPQAVDHPVVARLRAAGAVVVGQTNLPELGIYPFSDSVYGTSRNPWNLEVTAGGSSGGAARRWPPAWCRSRTGTTVPARSGSRPPTVGCSGSSRGRAWSRPRSARTAGTACPRTDRSPPRSPTRR